VDLTDAQCDELRHDLEDLAIELSEMIEGTREAAKPVELDQPAIGRVSRIDAIQQQKMLEANRNAQRNRVQLVRAALSRFEAEEYGDCAGCGECVGYARLKARPESVFCISCQSARERG
jgi:DnaK suppressor protein